MLFDSSTRGTEYGVPKRGGISKRTADAPAEKGFLEHLASIIKEISKEFSELFLVREIRSSHVRWTDVYYFVEPQR
jgi:hypothetical protein